MIPADVTVTAGWVDDAGRLSCALRRHPAQAPMSAPCTLSSAVQRATVNVPTFNVQRSTFNPSHPYSSLVTFSFLLVVCFPLAVMRMSLYNES